MKTSNNIAFTQNNDILLTSLLQKHINTNFNEEDSPNGEDKSEKLINAFLMNLSHEIRTPLNAIIGFSQFLHKSETDLEKKKYYLEIIRQNGHCLLGLMNNLMELSLIESRTEQLQISKFMIHELHDKLKEDINNLVLEKDRESLDVNFFISSCNKEYIESDFNKVYTVLLNIAKNAVMYSNFGSVKIGCERIKRQSILFYVIDSGPGIDKKDHKVIFEKFSKLEDHTFEGEPKGLGIGLAVCKSLVEALGGKIWLDSKPGKGSTFYFTVPVKPRVSKKRSTKTALLN